MSIVVRGLGGRVGRRRRSSGGGNGGPQGAQFRVLGLLVPAQVHLALEGSSA